MTINEGGNFIWLELFETLNTAIKRRDGRRVDFQSSEVIDGLRPCYATVARTEHGKQQLFVQFSLPRLEPNPTALESTRDFHLKFKMCNYNMNTKNEVLCYNLLLFSPVL